MTEKGGEDVQINMRRGKRRKRRRRKVGALKQKETVNKKCTKGKTKRTLKLRKTRSNTRASLHEPTSYFLAVYLTTLSVIQTI
jgi:hypothetical protein